MRTISMPEFEELYERFSGYCSRMQVTNAWRGGQRCSSIFMSQIVCKLSINNQIAL